MTILFRNDWLKYPGAKIHYSTKNKSFLKLAEIYYQMGLENCAFHLSLLDPDLENVDPFSPDLTVVQQAKILKECKLNFWYYLREISRIPEPGSPIAVQYQANRSNISLYWLFFNHVMTIIVILRQTGKTTTLMELVKYLLNFGSMNTFINLLTKSEGLKAESLRKVKALFEELPNYLDMSTKKDIFNTDEVHIKELNNSFKGNLSSASPKQAEKVGRGFTSPINLIDETAFIENIAIAMGAMLMSGNAARTAAERNGNPYGTILATTAGNTDDRDGGYVFELVTCATIWDEHFLDCKDKKELEELVYKNSTATKNQSKRPIVNISMSYRQLGYSDEWLEKKKRENISTPENLKRDLYNQWLSGSSSSPIPKEYIERMKNNEREPIWSEFYAPYNYLLRWFISKEEEDYLINNKVNFIIGVDTSDGSGGDDIAFTVRTHIRGDIICTATFNEINLITLADFFVSFLLKYTNSVMIIERKSSAITMIDYMVQKLLAHGINPFTRMYNTIFQSKEIYEKEYKEIINARPHDEQIFTKYKKHIGFITSGSGITSRSELYSTTLMSMLKYTCEHLFDEKLIRQISTLIIKNNRVDHPPGGHDDMVISSLLNYWILITGKNLELYGINTSSIMKYNDTYLEEKYNNDKDLYHKQELLSLEDEFNRLLEEYKDEYDEIVSRQIEARIYKLANELKSSNNVLSVSEMIDNIKRDKRVYRRR